MKAQAPVVKVNYELLGKILEVRSRYPKLAHKKTYKFQHREYVK